MSLTDAQVDALREMINIGIGRAAGVLNAMLRSHVSLQVPVVEIISMSELEQKAQEFGKHVFSAVRLGFKGPLSGNASLVFPAESAAKLVILLTEDETGSPDLDSIRIGTLTEVGNIILNGVMGVIGNEIQQHIYYSVPTYMENPIEALFTVHAPGSAGATLVWVQTRFIVEQHRIDGEIILMFEMGSLDLLLGAINREMGL